MVVTFRVGMLTGWNDIVICWRPSELLFLNFAA